MGCNFCEGFNVEYHRNHGSLLIEDDYCFSVVNWESVKPGHTMVLPKRHVVNLSELSGEEMKSYFTMVDNLRNRLREKYSEDVVLFMNTGRHRTESHLHVHLIPSKGNLRDLFHSYEKVPYREKLSDEKIREIRDFILE